MRNQNFTPQNSKSSKAAIWACGIFGTRVVDFQILIIFSQEIAKSSQITSRDEIATVSAKKDSQVVMAISANLPALLPLVTALVTSTGERERAQLSAPLSGVGLTALAEAPALEPEAG